MSKKSIAIILGTRPEIIKFAPLVHLLRDDEDLKPLVIFSGQHRDLAQTAFKSMNYQPDIDLDLMSHDQTPEGFLSLALRSIGEIFSNQNQIELTLVQGDTTTALAGALASFHRKIPVGHLEAGLRTPTRYSPFPEEMNRRLISQLASMHFCPTRRAVNNLETEGITEGVSNTGNTIVDALKLCTKQLDEGTAEISSEIQKIDDLFETIILVTGHRRENFSKPLQVLCEGLMLIRDTHPSTAIVYPLHPNPNIRKPVQKILGEEKNIFLLEPVTYLEMIMLQRESSLIITDSGGIQEEAPSFGVPMIVTRESTERQEVLKEGYAELLPLHDPKELAKLATKLLKTADQNVPLKNPFGDGRASHAILREIRQRI